MRYGISFASSSLHLSISRGETRREDVMIQLHLFPPPASPSAPLPSKACSEAKDLVASLLIAVIVANLMHGCEFGAQVQFVKSRCIVAKDRALDCAIGGSDIEDRPKDVI